MKRVHWLQLVALNLLVALCIFLPFLPGPYDNLSMAFSAIAQTTGFLGLLLVPVGILWLIQEIKKSMGANANPNNWSSGYYYAITATIISVVIVLFFAIGLLLMTGPLSAIVFLVVAAFAVYKLLPAIKALKQNTFIQFNAAPLYLLSVPMIAFVVRIFFIGPVSDFSRDYAIERGETLINGIENYYARNNHYPESIEELDIVPKPSIMGIEKFQYERRGDSYNLWFIQWQAIIATKEIVIYSKNDNYNVKGHYASFVAKKPHWKYYWLD